MQGAGRTRGPQGLEQGLGGIQSCDGCSEPNTSSPSFPVPSPGDAQGAAAPFSAVQFPGALLKPSWEHMLELIAMKHLALSLLGFVWRYVPKSLRPLKNFPPGLCTASHAWGQPGQGVSEGHQLPARSSLVPGAPASCSYGLFQPKHP